MNQPSASLMSVKQWAREAGLRDEDLVGSLKKKHGIEVSLVSMSRYLNGKRHWPFTLIVALKELSANKLIDASFIPTPKRARRAAPAAGARRTRKPVARKAS